MQPMTNEEEVTYIIESNMHIKPATARMLARKIQEAGLLREDDESREEDRWNK
jgi:hypothetical protein